MEIKMTITPEILSAVAGILISLGFSYIPGLNIKFALFTPEQKRLVMLLLTALTAVIMFGLACAGVVKDLFGLVLACDRDSALVLARSFVYAAVTNQTAYQLTPQTAKVRAVKVK
jgi:hypothetical protein